MSFSNSDLVEVALEHQRHLQACLRWQAKSGINAITRNAIEKAAWYHDVFVDLLNEAMTLTLVWIESDQNARAWQQMIREINRLWWDWYDSFVIPSSIPLPYECMNRLPRPDDFERELDTLRARVLKHPVKAAG